MKILLTSIIRQISHMQFQPQLSERNDFWLSSLHIYVGTIRQDMTRAYWESHCEIPYLEIISWNNLVLSFMPSLWIVVRKSVVVHGIYSTGRSLSGRSWATFLHFVFIYGLLILMKLFGMLKYTWCETWWALPLSKRWIKRICWF